MRGERESRKQEGTREDSRKRERRHGKQDKLYIYIYITTKTYNEIQNQKVNREIKYYLDKIIKI